MHTTNEHYVKRILEKGQRCIYSTYLFKMALPQTIKCIKSLRHLSYYIELKKKAK